MIHGEGRSRRRIQAETWDRSNQDVADAPKWHSRAGVSGSPHCPCAATSSRPIRASSARTSGGPSTSSIAPHPASCSATDTAVCVATLTSSCWSDINIARAEQLIATGRMRPEGLAAYRAGTEITTERA